MGCAADGKFHGVDHKLEGIKVNQYGSFRGKELIHYCLNPYILTNPMEGNDLISIPVETSVI